MTTATAVILHEVEQQRHEFAQKMIDDDNNIHRSSGNRCGSCEVIKLMIMDHRYDKVSGLPEGFVF